MTRNRRHLSRALLTALGITLALGLIFWVHKVYDDDDRETAASSDSHREAEPATAPATIETPQLLLSPATQPGAERGAVPDADAQIAAQITISPNAIPDGKAKLEAGDLLAARKILNDALVSRQLSPADAANARTMLTKIGQSVIFSSRAFPADEYAASYKVKSGDILQKIADEFDVTVDLICRLNGISDPRKLRAGQTLKIIRGPFSALVDKSDFTMDLWLGPAEERGSLYVGGYPVGLGASDSTPTGSWLVERHKKIRNPTYYSPRGEGVIAKDDPANPLGEHWIGLEGMAGQAIGQKSYGIHGTIEPHTIGKQESMGCIRMLNEDVARVFELLVEGDSILVVRE